MRIIKTGRNNIEIFREINNVSKEILLNWNSDAIHAMLKRKRKKKKRETEQIQFGGEIIIQEKKFISLEFILTQLEMQI